jgi:hypothetical protein
MFEDTDCIRLLERRPVCRPVGALVLLAVLSCVPGCSEDSWFGADKYCGDTRSAPKVYNGTLLPTYVPLTPQQMPAIGSFRLCSGTLISPTWVVTAKHCGLSSGVQFCIGYDPDSPDICITSGRVINHPDVDLTLVELTQDVRTRMPQLTTLGVMRDPMGSEWIGRQAEAAGYGENEVGSLGTRYFTAEPIVSLDRGLVTIDGQGQRGVCFGDSGGPLLVLADDGTVRVAGVLSNGDETCVGRDNFTRTELHLAWIEGQTGPLDSGTNQGCGQIGRAGRCDQGRAVWCGNERIQIDECDPGSACGWDESDGGFRCITGADPCEGFDSFGACDGNFARWCEDGVPQVRDCGACNQSCFASVDNLGAYCATDSCQGLGFQGRCDGDVAEWCEGGEVSRRDCGELGQTCAFVDDEVGYYCQDPVSTADQ